MILSFKRTKTLVYTPTKPVKFHYVQLFLHCTPGT